MFQRNTFLVTTVAIALLAAPVWSEECPADDPAGIRGTVKVLGESWNFTYQDFTRRHAGNIVRVTPDAGGSPIDFTGSQSDFHWSDDLGGIEWLMDRGEPFALWYPQQGYADFYAEGACYLSVQLRYEPPTS